MNMQPFTGKKWFCPDEYTIKIDCFGRETKVPVFQMTKAYANYLSEKEKLRKQHELLVLKNKLDYQYQTYGEVDKLDYDNYIRLLTNSNNVSRQPSKPTSKLSRQVTVYKESM